MAGHWFTKNLGDATLSGDAVTELETIFKATYGHPTGANTALFVRHESEGHLHCETVVYFSPGAKELAEVVDAEPCSRPAQDGLSLLAGAEQAWQALFPEDRRKT